MTALSQPEITVKFDDPPTVAQVIEALSRMDPAATVKARVRWGGALLSVSGSASSAAQTS